jgi:hypothetical protein
MGVYIVDMFGDNRNYEEMKGVCGWAISNLNADHDLAAENVASGSPRLPPSARLEGRRLRNLDGGQ